MCGGIVLIFSEGSLPPGEKIASLQIPRPEIRRISAESEKGWCGGEPVPSASGRAREGSQPSRISNQRDFRRKSHPHSNERKVWRGIRPLRAPGRAREGRNPLEPPIKGISAGNRLRSPAPLAMRAIAAAKMLSAFLGLANAADDGNHDNNQSSADDYSAHFQPLTFCLFS